MFMGGAVSLCGIARQRVIPGVDVDCRTCLRIAEALVHRLASDEPSVEQLPHEVRS
jgi:hypothetical protein